MEETENWTKRKVLIRTWEITRVALVIAGLSYIGSFFVEKARVDYAAAQYNNAAEKTMYERAQIELETAQINKRRSELELKTMEFQWNTIQKQSEINQQPLIIPSPETTPSPFFYQTPNIEPDYHIEKNEGLKI